jgi:hypothetical protein
MRNLNASGLAASDRCLTHLRDSTFVIPSLIRHSSFGFRHWEMIVRRGGATTCNPPRASLYQSLALTGRYRSGQTGQTVNLLALRLRWFESSPAHCPAGTAICELVSALFAGRHLPGDHRIRRLLRRRSRVRRLRAVALLADELHSRLKVGLRSPGH